MLSFGVIDVLFHQKKKREKKKFRKIAKRKKKIVIQKKKLSERKEITYHGGTSLYCLFNGRCRRSEEVPISSQD